MSPESRLVVKVVMDSISGIKKVLVEVNKRIEYGVSKNKRIAERVQEFERYVKMTGSTQIRKLKI